MHLPDGFPSQGALLKLIWDYLDIFSMILFLTTLLKIARGRLGGISHFLKPRWRKWKAKWFKWINNKRLGKWFQKRKEKETFSLFYKPIKEIRIDKLTTLPDEEGLYSIGESVYDGTSTILINLDPDTLNKHVFIHAFKEAVIKASKLNEVAEDVGLDQERFSKQIDDLVAEDPFQNEFFPKEYRKILQEHRKKRMSNKRREKFQRVSQAFQTTIVGADLNSLDDKLKFVLLDAFKNLMN